jgi:hypothetical protein
MIFYRDSDLWKLPREQRSLLVSRTFRKNLVERGHVLLEILEDNVYSLSNLPKEYKPWVQATEGLPMPVMAFAPKEGGAIKVIPLPETEEDLFRALK